MTVRDDRRDALHEFMRGHAAVTIVDMMRALDLGYKQVSYAIHDLRRKLRDDPTEIVSLVSTPQGWGKEHLFSLEADMVSCRPYHRGVDRDITTRLETYRASYVPLARGGHELARLREAGLRAATILFAEVDGGGSVIVTDDEEMDER